MDKQLLKAYIRTIVEEEVKRVLPELLGEAVQEIKKLNESAPTVPKKQIDKKRLAQLMGMEYDGETLRATNSGPSVGGSNIAPPNAPPEVEAALNRDYSELMKKMKLV